MSLADGFPYHTDTLGFPCSGVLATTKTIPSLLTLSHGVSIWYFGVNVLDWFFGVTVVDNRQHKMRMKAALAAIDVGPT